MWDIFVGETTGHSSVSDWKFLMIVFLLYISPVHLEIIIADLTVKGDITTGNWINEN